MQEQAMLRFFSMTDVEPIRPFHPEHARQVQAYFHGLFPRRKWQTVSDCKDNPLAIDVEVLYPTVEEPFYLLHTLGMSAAPMHCPVNQWPRDRDRYSELCMMLPADWPFRPNRPISLSDSAGWPLWLLMELGRVPHMHQICMTHGFVLANTESHAPFSSQAPFSGVAMVQFEGELGEIPLQDGRRIELLMPLLLYTEEMALCDTIGVDAVAEEIVEENGGSFALDIHRQNVASRTYQENIL